MDVSTYTKMSAFERMQWAIKASDEELMKLANEFREQLSRVDEIIKEIDQFVDQERNKA